MNSDIRFFGKYVDEISVDLERIVSSKEKSPADLRKNIRTVEGIVTKFREIMDDKRERRPNSIKPEDETKIDEFLKKCDALVRQLKTVLATFEAPGKKPKGKTEKTSPKKSPSKKTTRKAKPSDPEKEKEKQEKLLAKEAEKQQKLLEKENAKMLAKETAKLEKQATKEKEKQVAKERKVATKKQSAVFEPEQILKDKVATIAFQKNELQTLSNFWPCLVTITEKDDIYQYSSGEHAFHGEKFRRLSKLSKNATRKAELLRYSKQFLRCNDGGMSALDAKHKGGKSGLALTTEEIAIWEKLSLKVQREISGWKATIPEVRADLANTGTRLLVYSDMHTAENIWEGKAVVNEKGKVDVLGKNWLGRIWIEVREKM